MKMKKITLAVVLAGAAATGIVGCHDSKDRVPSSTTNIEVFDGYALECLVEANGIAATEVGGGTYALTDRSALPNGAVISASNCVDADTGTLLPTLRGVSQPGGGVVSPITTLIVAAALAQNPGADTANLTDEALATAADTILTKLGIEGYDPLDPATANYVDTIDQEASQATMQLGIALATLLKTVEAAAGDNAADAITALATAIVDTESTIDLTSPASLVVLLQDAATVAPELITAFQDVTLNAVPLINAIASADSVNLAAGIAQAVGEVLDAGGGLDTVAEIDPETIEPIEVGTGGGTDPVTPPTGGTGGTGG